MARSIPKFLVILSLFFAIAEAREKIDLVLIKNGDRVTGEIKDLDRGRLKVDTGYMGVVEIEWEQVASVTSPQDFEIEDSIGETFFGPLPEPAELETIAIEDGPEQTTLERDSVIYLTPIGKNFWTRLKANVDLGFSFTRANRAVRWNLDAAAHYIGRSFESRADFSSLLTNQEGSTQSTRNVLGLRFDRWLKDRWFVTGVGRGEQNDELRLDFRALFGAGIGRNMVQSNRLRLDLIGGAAYSRERFVTEPSRNNAEAVAGIYFDFFTFGDHEADITANLIFYPNLLTSGRYRTDLDTRLKHEVLKDLNVGIGFFYNYDSKPPSQVATKLDYGIRTTIGYEF